jgi:hypothetical protein
VYIELFHPISKWTWCEISNYISSALYWGEFHTNFVKPVFLW